MKNTISVSVSTKKGDKGKTYLINGEKISKSNFIFDVLGTLDELNSHLGLVVAKIKSVNSKDKNIVCEFNKNMKFLLDIQSNLFHLGAQLAGSSKIKLNNTCLLKLERESNRLQKQMADNWITKFVLPGGTELAAYLDITRTVCRRLERLVVGLSEKKKISNLVLKYLNRLSDYLFILRCFVNDANDVKEKLFIKK